MPSPALGHRIESNVTWLRAPLTAREERTNALEGLTNRELDVLRRIALAAGNDEIAQALCISLRTVESHIRSLYLKLDLWNQPGRVERRVAAALLYLESCGVLSEPAYGVLRRHPAAGRLIRESA